MKYIRIHLFCIIFLVVILLSACSSLEKEDRALYPDGVPTSSVISISTAESKLQQVSKDDDIYFICENIDFHKGRIYYIFRKCESETERVVTSAWYAVDVFTGEIYRYNDLGDESTFEPLQSD